MSRCRVRHARPTKVSRYSVRYMCRATRSRPYLVLPAAYILLSSNIYQRTTAEHTGSLPRPSRARRNHQIVLAMVLSRHHQTAGTCAPPAVAIEHAMADVLPLTMPVVPPPTSSAGGGHQQKRCTILFFVHHPKTGDHPRLLAVQDFTAHRPRAAVVPKRQPLHRRHAVTRLQDGSS